MKVLIHAPSGTATLTISGGDFTSMSSDTSRFPACKIDSFSKSEISVSHTAPDDGDGTDHFHFNLDWEQHPLSSGSIDAETTTGATMAVIIGRETTRVGQNESKNVLQWFGFGLSEKE